MVKQKARSTAIDLRTAKKLLGQYETEVLVAAKELKRVRRALISMGEELAEGATEGRELTEVQEVLRGDRSLSANFADALGVLSKQRTQPMEVDLTTRRAELTRILDEMSQWRATKKTIRDRITSERKATRDKASEQLQELESAIFLGGEQLRKAQRRLRPLEQELAGRERSLLKWGKKTETLRAQVAKLRQECVNHHASIRQSEEQLDAARIALTEARAKIRPESNHPDLKEPTAKLDELSKRQKEVRIAVSALNRQVTAVRKDYGDRVGDLERRFRTCSRALFRAMRAVPSLSAPVSTSDRLWLPVDSDFDNWLVECETRRARASVLLGSAPNTTSSDEDRTLREAIFRDLTSFGNRREQQLQRAKAQKAQQAKDRQRQRERAARELAQRRIQRQRQEARRERQIIAANRRDLRRAVKRQQAAEAALREFERENPRLGAKIEQNSNAHDNAESRVLRVLTQMRARNPHLTLEHIRANRSLFPSYDNARARVEDLETERQRLQHRLLTRARLEQAKSDADDRVAAELRSQSPSTTREGGWAHRIEVNEWEDAERLAEKHMQYLGYTDARRTNAGADGGVDVESRRAVAQVKDQSNPVGRHLIQQLYGVARSQNKKAIFFARRYAPQAVGWARENDVKLYQFNRAGVVSEVF